MEDILAIGSVLVVVGIFVFVVQRILKSRQQQAEQKAHREELMAKLKLEDQKTRDKIRQSAIRARKELEQKHLEHKFSVPPRGKETTVTYAPSPTQSVQSSSFLSDAADIAMIANTIHHWNDNKPHRSNTDNPIDFPKEERSVGVSKSESSWGFDDSDSRRSARDTFSSSSSDSWSSSSSDSYSSSSDSGPSSDW